MLLICSYLPLPLVQFLLEVLLCIRCINSAILGRIFLLVLLKPLFPAVGISASLWCLSLCDSRQVHHVRADCNLDFALYHFRVVSALMSLSAMVF